MSDDLFTVDLEFRNGARREAQFVTQQEAVAYAGRMAMDAGIVRSEVRGLDAEKFDNDLYGKVDVIGGRAFMTGAGEVRTKVGRKVERIKRLLAAKDPAGKKEAQELIRWAESSNDPIPSGW